MRLLHALFAILLALGASLPACATAHGCEPAAPTPAHAHQHHLAAPSTSPSPDGGDRHAGTCIGCAVELPDAQRSSAPDVAATAPETWPQVIALAGRFPDTPVRPPRALA